MEGKEREEGGRERELFEKLLASEAFYDRPKQTGPKGIDHKRDFPELAKCSSAFVCCFNVITSSRKDRRDCLRDETRM